MSDIYELVKNEGWDIFLDDETGTEKIRAYGEVLDLKHPINVHFKFYREETNPARRYSHMRAIHDYLWPEDVPSWNYWTERRFQAHCDGKNYIAFAGGANCSKSYDAAKIALIFWLANPEKRTVIVASTTLSSLDSRIWGYVKKFLRKTKIPLPVDYKSQPPPKILFKKLDGHKDENIKDTIHGMFAIAAKKGDEDEAISGWIGRHPDDSLLMILDEATDMPLSIVKAFPNLEAKPDKFQLIAIGNSLSKFDLHGTLCTPKAGWSSVDPLRDHTWETTQRNGVCLFFSCYESPAVHETDPIKRAILSRFLITQEEIILKEAELGKDSDSFYRFVLGFWKSGVSAEVVIDPDYVERYRLQDIAAWSGVNPLHFEAGLDPSFTTGGDSCILRLAMLGVDVRGKMVLDFRGDKFLFKIPIIATSSKSVELQIADAVLKILGDYGIKLEHLCIDANGAGRLLGEVLRQRCNGLNLPLRVVSTRLGANLKEIKQDNILVKSAYDLWLSFKPFIGEEQIRGLDNTTLRQMTNRLVIVDQSTNKVKLESKSEFKRRMGTIVRGMGRSPDEADAAAMTLQSAIVNFGFYSGQQMKLENPFMLEKMYYMQKAIVEEQKHSVPAPEKFEVTDGFSVGIEEAWNTQKVF